MQPCCARYHVAVTNAHRSFERGPSCLCRLLLGCWNCRPGGSAVTNAHTCCQGRPSLPGCLLLGCCDLSLRLSPMHIHPMREANNPHPNTHAHLQSLFVGEGRYAILQTASTHTTAAHCPNIRVSPVPTDSTDQSQANSTSRLPTGKLEKGGMQSWRTASTHSKAAVFEPSK
jgi:hypothetical protein